MLLGLNIYFLTELMFLYDMDISIPKPVTNKHMNTHDTVYDYTVDEQFLRLSY